MRTAPLTILLILLATSLFLNVYQFTSKEKEVARDTVRTTFVDTIPYYKPVPKDSFVINYITKTLPVVPQEDSRGLSSDSVSSPDSTARDSVQVQISITQKVYRDSSYTVYVSGYEPSLDSLTLHIPHSVTTVTKIIQPKRSRWSIGMQVGYGVSLSPTPQYAPYVGVGVQYSLFNF